MSFLILNTEFRMLNAEFMHHRKTVVIARALNGAPQRRMAFVGGGEAKTQVEFFACGKCSIVACASTMWQSHICGSTQGAPLHPPPHPSSLTVGDGFSVPGGRLPPLHSSTMWQSVPPCRGGSCARPQTARKREHTRCYPTISFRTGG